MLQSSSRRTAWPLGKGVVVAETVEQAVGCSRSLRPLKILVIQVRVWSSRAAAGGFSLFAAVSDRVLHHANGSRTHKRLT